MRPQPVDRAQTPVLVDSGFALLRTPLLPVGVFLEWSGRVQDGAAPDGAEPALWALSTLREIASDPALREAIRVASVSLSSEVDSWLAGARPSDPERLLHSLVRYFSRATYRCTPFGLFAGCSIVPKGDRTELRLAGRSAYTRTSRIDFDHLAELSRVLSAEPECRRRVPLRTNSSVALLGGRLHYVEVRYAGRARQYELTAADATPEILDALARGRQGTTFDDLRTPLLAQGYSQDEVDAFITELLDAQLLVPDVEPLLSGGDAALALATTLETAACAPAVSAALREVGTRLRAIDADGVGGGRDYEHVIAPLRALDVPVDETKILQVDLFKPAPAASVGPIVLADVIEAVQLLAGITVTMDPLAAFAQRFEARYETREVPLLEALDDEIGIGLPGATSNTGHADAHARRERILADLRCRAAAAHATAVELADEDLQLLKWPDARPLTASLAFFGNLAATSAEAVDRGEYRLVVRYAVGPSGARFLGRFGHLDSALESQIRLHLEAEEALHTQAVFAEIVHLPQGRIGNVVARPRLRAYEIPYLGRGSAPAEQQIDPADLRLSVRRGRVILRSAKLDREVQPRLSCAHNYQAAQNLPVYRFLCLLQDHGARGAMRWSWGAQGSAAFLPRVTRGRLVLSCATWNLSEGDIRDLAQATAPWDGAAVDAWRRRLELPRFVLLAQNDNALLVDLENRISVRVLARLLKSRQAVALVEPIPTPDELCTSGPEGSFTNEIVVPLVRTVAAGDAERTEATRAPRVQTAGIRAYAPGSEWLYAKLYCGKGSADHILRRLVAPLLLTARAELPLRNWFFLRYADPDFHIRLRLNAGAEAAPRLFQLLGTAAAPLIASGALARLVFDTYQPELERYGGPEGIGIAEALFSVDSDAALAHVTGADHLPALRDVPRELAALAGVDRLLSDADLSVEDRVSMMERMLGQVPTAVRQARSKAFRQHRAAVAAMLSPDDGDDGLKAVRSVLAIRSAGIRPLLSRLRGLEAAGALKLPLADLLPSYHHMWINRMLVDGAAVEPVLYDRLLRTYQSLLGRARATSRQTATHVEPVTAP